jgi:hypothetical protein
LPVGPASAAWLAAAGDAGTAVAAESTFVESIVIESSGIAAFAVSGIDSWAGA